MISIGKLAENQRNKDLFQNIYDETEMTILCFKQEIKDSCGNDIGNESFDITKLTIDHVVELNELWIRDWGDDLGSLEQNLRNLININQPIVSEMARVVYDQLNSLLKCKMTIDHEKWREVLKRIVELEKFLLKPLTVF
ncbi:MAG: hypothetical protein NTX76_03575 [Alphaproteobacteria bacterium]|nr:hypothetical protein [Alphaproteobacteria bacterium]